MLFLVKFEFLSFSKNNFREDQHKQAHVQNIIFQEKIAKHCDAGYRGAAKEALRVSALPQFYVCE